MTFSADPPSGCGRMFGMIRDDLMPHDVWRKRTTVERGRLVLRVNTISGGMR
jgi:hypothetical protein